MDPQGDDSQESRSRAVRSEVDYRMLAEQFVDPLVAVSEGIVRWVGASIGTTLGWTPDEVAGTRLVDLCHSDDAESLLGLLERVAQGQTSRGVFRLQVRDGGFVWTLLTMGPGLDEDGRSGSIGSIREINTRIETESRLLLIAEHAANMLYTTGLDGRITWTSSQAASTLGWAAGELVGSLIAQHVHSDDLPAFERRMVEMLGGEEVAEHAGGDLLRIRRRDGSYAWMRATLAALRDAEGHREGVVGGLSDVDDLVAPRSSVRRESFRAQLIVDSLFDPHVVLSPVVDGLGRVVDFRFADANKAACGYMGVLRHEVIGSCLGTLLSGDAPPGLIDAYANALQTGDPLILDDVHDGAPGGSGAGRHVEIRAIRVDHSLSVIWRDMTDRHSALQALTASEEQYRLLAENSSDVVVRSREGVVTWVSPSLMATLGWLPDEWVGAAYADLLHPDDRDAHAAIRGEEPATGSLVHRYRLRDRSLAYHWVEEHRRTYIDADGSPDGIVGSFHIIDAEVAAEAELVRRAQHDALTGLLNRHEILERIGLSGGRQRRSGSLMALLFCDIDRLKAVNDTHGHATGDETIREIASRISACIRSDDAAARVGGDEILVLLKGVRDLQDAAGIAEKIRVCANEPIRIGDHVIAVSLSIGVALARSDEGADELVARADRAMYEAKQSGRDRVVTIR